MDTKVEKRDGSIVEFDSKKIEDAIYKASSSMKNKDDKVSKAKAKEYSEIITEKIKELKKPIVQIEYIQDEVENTLISNGYVKLAKSYIKYRRDHERMRETKSELFKAIYSKADATNVQNQNANVDEHSFGGRRGEVSNIIMERLALDTMSEKQRERFLNNEIYPHDKDSYYVGMHNCLSIPDDIILDYGFEVRQTDVRPSNSIATTGQLSAVVGQIQSLQQFGGFAYTHMDTTFASSIRKSFKKDYDLVSTIKYNKPFKDSPNNSESIDSDKYKGKNIFDFKKRKVYKYALEMVKREMAQTCEGLFHNYNTLMSRSGNQLPFSSINYGLDTTTEGRIAINALLDATIKGLGKMYRTSIFPCGIFQLKDGINNKLGDPNYDLKRKALYSTVKRFYPNYMNCDWSVQVAGIKKDREIKRNVISKLTPELRKSLIEIFKDHPDWAEKINIEIVDNELSVFDRETPTEIGGTMGCRTYNGFDINFDEKYFLSLLKEIVETKSLPRNYLFSAMQKDGRGNIAPSTIIMPTIAMEARLKWESDKDKESDIIDIFMQKLENAIDDTKDFLIERFEHICSQKPESASFMYDNNTMKGYIKSQGIRSALKHGTLAIGQIGLAETLQILIGKNHLTDEGMEVAKRIESLFLNKCNDFKNQYKLNFGVYYTPAENLCYTSMKKFKKTFGNHPYVKDLIKKEVLRDYFTNSIHVPVWEKVDPFKKIDIESQLTGYSNAGCITYVELDGKIADNIDAVEQILQYAKDKDCPYIAFNIPADCCLDCGFIGDFSESKKCVKCGSEHVLMPARVTGYLTGDYRTSFNKGKQKEKEDRVKHSKFMNGLGISCEDC